MKSNTKQLENKAPFFVTILKGSLMALSFCLIAILIFAFALRIFTISDNAIRPVNQVIKILSIFFGTLFGLKKVKEMGLILGMLIGLLFTIISYVSFSLLDGNFQFGISFLNDCLFGAITGGISGIIAVNFKKK